MPEPQHQAEETNQRSTRMIRQWKRIFFIIYLAFTIAAVLVAFFSILAVHLGATQAPIRKGRRIKSKAEDPKELRDCHRRLKKLATELHRETFTLQAKALRFETNPAVEWRNWSAGWKHRWRYLDYRCRLSELADTGASNEIDKMAAIHRSLEELQLSYSGVVESFVERYVSRLHTLKEELSFVRAMIDRRKPTRPRPGHGVSK